MKFSLSIVAFIVATTQILQAASVSENDSSIIVKGENYTVEFSSKNGSINKFIQNGTVSSLKSSSSGLWEAAIDDKKTLKAADCEFSYSIIENRKLIFKYKNKSIESSIEVQPEDKYIAFKSELKNLASTPIMGFSAPGTLCVDPEKIESFICQTRWPRTVGTAFNKEFFRDHADDTNVFRWTDKVYQGQISGTIADKLAEKNDGAKEAPLLISEKGANFLGKAALELNGKSVKAIRPTFRNKCELVIAESDGNIYYGGSSFGGKGFLFRPGAAAEREYAETIKKLTELTLEKISSQMLKDGRGEICIIRFPNAPGMGFWTTISVNDWENMMSNLSAVKAGKLKLRVISSIDELKNAASNQNCAAILNPYGEMMVSSGEGKLGESLALIENFVKKGGFWFETSGHPFYYEMLPARFLSTGPLERNKSPGSFADFYHFKLKSGDIAIFGVQPQNYPEWSGAVNKSNIIVPVEFSAGGSEEGGYLKRRFGIYLKKDESMKLPEIRVLSGCSILEASDEFCKANAIKKSLADKLDADKLEKIKNAILVKMEFPTASGELASLDKIPSPSIIHLVRYLKGGFDKEYPDHLPPNPKYGSPEEFKKVIAESQKRGHLVMPYTNPTWWCDTPKGPYFLEKGDAGLLRTLENKPRHEVYGKHNDGWTTTLWHPDVQYINRKVIDQFTKEYPVDIIFQDQCGARDWQYDLNPASPTPYAYAEGMVSMVREDSKRTLLSTEDAWSGVLDSEVQTCGLTFDLMPRRNEEAGGTRHIMEFYNPETWTIFPLSHALAHDKVSMTHHDLGQSVNDPRMLSWTLALGYSMIFQFNQKRADSAERVEWLKFLGVVQKTIASRYTGAKLKDFSHSWEGGEYGTVNSVYGDMKIQASLSAKEIDGLAPYGFRISSPDLIAGYLKNMTEFMYICPSGNDAYVFAIPGTVTGIPEKLTDGRALSITFEDGSKAELEHKNGFVYFKTPASGENYRKVFKIKIEKDSTWKTILRTLSH